MLTRCGDDLFSVTVDAPPDAQALAVQLRQAGTWQEVVPGINSVVVRFDLATMEGAAAQAAIEAVLAEGIRPSPGNDRLVEIAVTYDGPDLNELSDKTGLSVAEIVELHTGSDYPVEMIGFTPGFAFIGGLDERLRIPRRDEPRQLVPAGSVGIADGRTGLYAMASPGGWTLIGRTSHQLFDPAAEQPFALEPGMRVRFRATAPDCS